MGPLYLDPTVISFNIFYFFAGKILARTNEDRPNFRDLNKNARRFLSGKRNPNMVKSLVTEWHLVTKLLPWSLIEWSGPFN